MAFGVRNDRLSSGKYRGFFTDYTGKKRFFTGSKSKAETRRAAARLEERHQKIKIGELPVPDVIDKHRARPIEEAKEEYVAWGKMQGGRGGRAWSQSHAKRKGRLLDLWIETLNLKTLGDLDGLLPRAEAVVQELSKRGKSGKTLQNTLEAMKSFINWCLIRNYLREDPLKGFSKIDTTPNTQRRAMTPDEFHRLLTVAPYHRQVLYSVAMVTGLRANELRSLTRDDLDVEQQGLRLRPEWTKNRKPGFQPLPEGTVKLLVEYWDTGIVSRLYCQYLRTRVFNPRALLYVPAEPGKDLDRDLKAAKITKSTSEGKLDFHAIRTAFVSWSIEAGANMKEVQHLARHSDPRITFNTYARIKNQRLSDVVEKVADQVTFDQFGADMVHTQPDDVTQESVKLLAAKEVIEGQGDWSRGESNPHLRDATAS